MHVDSFSVGYLTTLTVSAGRMTDEVEKNLGEVVVVYCYPSLYVSGFQDNSPIFWDVTSCYLVDVHRLSEEHTASVFIVEI
jgi:hypothetical protein